MNTDGTGSISSPPITQIRLVPKHHFDTFSIEIAIDLLFHCLTPNYCVDDLRCSSARVVMQDSTTELCRVRTAPADERWIELNYMHS